MPSLALNATEAGSNVYAGVHAPDVVGKIRVDQAWGLIQLSASAHEVNASYNSLGLSGLPASLDPRGRRPGLPNRPVIPIPSGAAR